MHISLFIHLKRLNDSDLDSFNLILMDFYQKDLSQTGALEISKFYYESIIPIKDKIEANQNYDIAAKIITITDSMTGVIVDLKNIANEMAKFVNEYVSELDFLEEKFKTESKEIFKYGT